MKALFISVCFFAASAVAKVGTTALAAELTAPAASTSRFLGWPLQKIRAEYAALFLGPTIRNFDGNTEGKGSFLAMRNYLSAGIETAPNWILETGGEFRQHWRDPDPKRPDRKDGEMRDPYIGINRRNIIGGEIFSLGAKARYFLPVTEYNLSRRGKPDDAGRGELTASLSPFWRMADGALNVGCVLDGGYKFDKDAGANRENYSVRAKPQAAYRFHRRLGSKVEYSTGFFRHANNGRWTKFNDRLTGQKLLVGLVWLPLENVSLNPGLAWGSHTFRLNSAELSLYASVTLL